MRDPTDPEKPMFILPFRYLNEVKWRPEHVLSMWRHIDKVCAGYSSYLAAVLTSHHFTTLAIHSL